MRVIAFLYSLYALSVFSQTEIKGKIIDNQSNAIAFATIYAPTLEQSTQTDQFGNFTFKLIKNQSNLLVEVRAFGFLERSFTIYSNQNNILTLAKDENIHTTEEITVTGTMLPESKSESPVPVEIYSKDYFKANPTPTLFESMQNVNGVRPKLNCNVCNTGDIHINGLEGPYTMILIDGMPIVSGLSTVYGLNGIPQALIERVEIVKGPASTLYGSEAVGGLINVITKSPTDAPLFSAEVMTTSWLETTADIGTKVKLGEKADALIGINYFNYNNPMDYNRDNITDVTLQNRVSLFSSINFKRKQNKVFTLAGRYNYEDRWGGELNWTPEYRGGDSIYGESIYTNRWEMFGKYEISKKIPLNFQFSANGHHQNSVYGDMKFIAEQYVTFGQLLYNKRLFNKHNVLMGAALRYTFYDDDTEATSKESYNPHTYLPGFFIQDDIKINEQNRLLLGARYDYNNNHGSILSPRVNYKWNTENKQTILRLSAGNGYRIANVFTEDHAALTGARELVFQEELKPETSYNVNLNAEQKIYSLGNSILSLDGSIFYTYFTNRILGDFDVSPNQIIYSNVDGNAISKGVSLSAKWSFYNGIKLKVAGTVMDNTYEENGQTFRPILTEQYNANWSASYVIKRFKLKIDYTGNLYGPMRLPLLGELDDRPEYSPIWSLQNIQLTKEYKAFEFFGGVKNFLNYTPPANSISRAHDPFDKYVQFDNNGNALSTAENPTATTFDPSYVFAPNQGIRFFIGFRLNL
ncbi:MAG: TonB-dependent receptor [Lishizhenia sp.]